MNNAHHTAIHEAGHAVIGRVLGLPCGSATIVPDEAAGLAGSAQISTPDDTYDFWFERRGKKRNVTRMMANAARANIRTWMAGAEAEKELLGVDGETSEMDLFYIDEAVTEECMEGSNCDWLNAVLRRQTQRLVRKHRDAIQRVANALLERRTLSGAEIDALVR